MTGAARIRVVIADDHPFYRASLARLLERNGFEVVAEVPNGEASIDAAERLRPDVVVMDLSMPGTSGVDATRRLTAARQPVPVLVLSVSADECDVTDAILAGASGYMLKDRPQAEILSGIRAAAAGQAPLSPRIAAMLVKRLREDSPVDDQEIRFRVVRLTGANGRAPARGPARASRRW